MVYEMHTGAKEDQQNGGNDGFFAGHKNCASYDKGITSILQPGCNMPPGKKNDY